MSVCQAFNMKQSKKEKFDKLTSKSIITNSFLSKIKKTAKIEKKRYSGENEVYRDISWLMPKIDVQDILERLGVRVYKKEGDEIWGWCPDHYLYTGRYPSHPKWSVNIKTGQSNCFTEPRGGNLLYITARIRKCEIEEAVTWMAGEGIDLSDVAIRNMQEDLKRLTDVEGEKPKVRPDILDTAEKWLETGKMYKSGYEFFMHPPGKPSTLITKETVDKYKCVQLKSGFYTNRVIVPCFLQKKLISFTAIDILGKKKWLELHPTIQENEYRKVRYPKGVSQKNQLFGYDNVEVGSQVILTEGLREVMKLTQLGYNALSIGGAKMSGEQVQLLAELNPSKVGLMFDGDKAGESCQKETFEKLKEFFRVVPLNTPTGYDPKCMPEIEVRNLLGESEFFCCKEG